MFFSLSWWLSTFPCEGGKKMTATSGGFGVFCINYRISRFIFKDGRNQFKETVLSNTYTDLHPLR